MTVINQRVEVVPKETANSSSLYSEQSLDADHAPLSKRRKNFVEVFNVKDRELSGKLFG